MTWFTAHSFWVIPFLQFQVFAKSGWDTETLCAKSLPNARPSVRANREPNQSSNTCLMGNLVEMRTLRLDVSPSGEITSLMMTRWLTASQINMFCDHPFRWVGWNRPDYPFTSQHSLDSLSSADAGLFAFAGNYSAMSYWDAVISLI